MNLSVDIKPDFEGTISITDYTRDFDEYIPEESTSVLTQYDSFKYSESCTINILQYISTKSKKLINVFYSLHQEESDSIRLPLPKDGYYSIHHLVLPTLKWLDSVKDEDLSWYNSIYVTDGKLIYRYYNGNLIQENPLLLTEVNPYKTTISISSFQIFSIDRLKHCYASISRQIMNNYVGKCSSIDSNLKFNRDFLWMTLNVISYYLEWDKYSEAQIVLEDLKCHNFCPEANPFKIENVSCGCQK